MNQTTIVENTESVTGGVDTIEVVKTSNPPCEDCGGKCCRNYIVPVTGHDVWRLNTHQRLSPESFLVAGHQQGEHSDGFVLEAGGRSQFMALDKKGDFNRYKPCVFLVELADGRARCGVYASRPTVCRVYPMTIHAGRIGLHEHLICSPNAWSAEEMSRPTWLATLKRTYMEFDIYSEVVKRWNARVAHSPGETFTLHEYYSYLLNVYSKLAQLEAETPPDEMLQFLRSWPTPPRAGGSLEEMRLCRGDIPWLEYITRARAIIDLFYPHVPPQPVTVPIATGY